MWLIHKQRSILKVLLCRGLTFHEAILIVFLKREISWQPCKFVSFWLQSKVEMKGECQHLAMLNSYSAGLFFCHQGFVAWGSMAFHLKPVCPIYRS